MGAFLSTEVWPFALATGLLIAVAATEALALVIGASAWRWLDGTFHDVGDGGPEGLASAALGWLHFGKVPILAILVIFLTAFAVIGFGAQFMVKATTGRFMPLLLATGLAFVVGVCAVRVLGTALARIIPKDETSAVADASLVGRVGTIVIGMARAGQPAETRIRDEHGATHYVMVEPEGADETFESGARVLLVRHLSGRRFHAIRNPKPELL